jgi:hypothetical protein
MPKLTFPDGYMAAGTWVSGTFGTGTVTLPLTIGVLTTLPLEAGILTFHVSDGLNGTIAGAVDPGHLEDALTPWLETFGLCPGNATFDQVVLTMTESADLVTGAPELQDTTVTCNAISVGLGFELAPVQPPTTISPTPTPAPGPCH